MTTSKAHGPHKAKADLTTGDIRGHLVRMTLPMIWGILAIVSFQLVDAYYISRLGTHQLAAFSFTFPVTYGIFSLFIGMSIATSSVISRMAGAGNFEQMRRVTSHAMLLVLIISLSTAAIGIPLLDPLFRACGADEASLALIKSYMIPYFIGTFFVSMPVVGNAALRAVGDAVRPAMIMTLAALINAALAPILVFGLWGFPRMELQGAALATISSNFMAMVAGLCLMYRRGLFDLAHITALKDFGDSCKRLLIIALPAGLTSMLPSFVNATVNHILAKTGLDAVAAFGAATRVEAFTFVIMMALSIGMAPIIGQNWGARLFPRVRQTIRDALAFSLIWSILVAVCLFFFAHPLAALFGETPEFQHYLVLFFMIIPISYPLSNLTNGWGSVFNAVGEPKISALFYLIKLIILMIPAAFIGYAWDGPRGTFIAMALVNVFTGLVFHYWAKKHLNKLECEKT